MHAYMGLQNKFKQSYFLKLFAITFKVDLSSKEIFCLFFRKDKNQGRIQGLTTKVT